VPERLFRIALVDDHEIISVALASALEYAAGLEFAGSASTVNELFSSTENVDLVVLDLRLADGSSPVNNVARIEAEGAQSLAFTSAESPHLIRLVARSGALGVVRKSEPLSVLLDALARSAAGDPIISTEWAAAIDSDPALSDAGLSPQEQKVLTLFADGNKTQVVASVTGLSIGTVEDYIRRIRAKYSRSGRPANTKIDLYKRALEDGFLPLPEGRQ
jgi:two-component system response regulator DevR